MESTIWRRFECLSRHLLFSASQSNHQLLLPSTLAAVQLESVDSSPVVIGGMVLDIHAKPSTPAKSGTTTPGKTLWKSGGVARNIAECMSKLGCRPFIISVLGLDIPGEFLLKFWRSAGLSTEGIQQHEDITTPVVSNIFDVEGELAAAVASVEAVEKFLTPEWIWHFRGSICSAPILVVDANMNPSSLEAACQIALESGVPVWFEPVSVTKSKHIASIAKFVTSTSPNIDELFAMAKALSSSDEFTPIQLLESDRKAESMESLFLMLKPAIFLLLKKGIKIVVVTLGLHGVFLCSKEGPNFMRNTMRNSRPSSYKTQLHELVSSSCPSHQFAHATRLKQGISDLYVLHFPALPASVVSLTGAGDCLVGGAITSICAGLDIMQGIAVGMAVAKSAVETDDNVPSQFSVTRVADDAKEVYSAAKEIIVDQQD